MLDPVEMFMEECSTIPGQVSRLLLLMRELDQQNHDVMHNLERRRGDVIQRLYSNIPSVPEGDNEEELQKIRSLGKISKSLMKERIAVENQLLHMVKYERERLSQDCQKLVRDVVSVNTELGEDSAKPISSLRKPKNPLFHQVTPAVEYAPSNVAVSAYPSPVHPVVGTFQKNLSDTGGPAESQDAIDFLSAVSPTNQSNFVIPLASNYRKNAVAIQQISEIGYDSHALTGRTSIAGNPGSEPSPTSLVHAPYKNFISPATVPSKTVSALQHPINSVYKNDRYNANNDAYSRKKQNLSGSNSDVSGLSFHDRASKKQRHDKISGPVGTSMRSQFSPKMSEDTISPRGMRISMASSRLPEKKFNSLIGWKPPNVMDSRGYEDVSWNADMGTKRILPRTEWNRPQYTSMVETSVECLAEEDLWDGICPICQKGESETHQHMMVGCDACNNWFHFECVNYNATGSEDAAWFCPQCIATGLVPQTARLQDTKASRSRRR